MKDVGKIIIAIIVIVIVWKILKGLIGLLVGLVVAGLVVYPNPSVAHCVPCAYREPCIALNMGVDPTAILAERYRDRGPEEVEEGRLGGVSWSMNRGARPPAFGG